MGALSERQGRAGRRLQAGLQEGAGRQARLECSTAASRACAQPPPTWPSVTSAGLDSELRLGVPPVLPPVHPVPGGQRSSHSFPSHPANPANPNPILRPTWPLVTTAGSVSGSRPVFHQCHQFRRVGSQSASSSTLEPAPTTEIAKATTRHLVMLKSSGMSLLCTCRREGGATVRRREAKVEQEGWAVRAGLGLAGRLAGDRQFMPTGGAWKAHIVPGSCHHAEVIGERDEDQRPGGKPAAGQGRQQD